MPSIIDYAEVLKQAERMGLRSLYHNSGAFGFARGAAVEVVGWLLEEDPTIRPAAREMAVRVSPGDPAELARLAREAWQRYLPVVAWVLPMSHWAFELEHGHRDWMPQLLREIGIDPVSLAGRNTGDALAFEPGEVVSFERLVQQLLGSLTSSDFALLAPPHPVICMLHHHRQLWWQTPHLSLAAALRNLPNCA